MSIIVCFLLLFITFRANHAEAIALDQFMSENCQQITDEAERPPCWFGITLGETTIEGGVASLTGHPWITGIVFDESEQIVTWRWSEAAPHFLRAVSTMQNPPYFFAQRERDRSPRQWRISRIHITTTLTLGRMFARLGTPSLTWIAYTSPLANMTAPAERRRVDYAVAYTDTQLTLSTTLQCPADLFAFLSSSVLTTWDVAWPSGNATASGVVGSAMTNRIDTQPRPEAVRHANPCIY